MATTSFTIFPVRSIEDFFPDNNLNEIAQRIFGYLEFVSWDESASLAKRLREVHYIDMLGGNTDEVADWLDPYFFIADVTDYADYSGWAMTDNPHGLSGSWNKGKGKQFNNAQRPIISGRGTIAINVANEEQYKIIVNMLPEQIEWGLEVIAYLKTGSFR